MRTCHPLPDFQLQKKMKREERTPVGKRNARLDSRDKGAMLEWEAFVVADMRLETSDLSGKRVENGISVRGRGCAFYSHTWQVNLRDGAALSN